MPKITFVCSCNQRVEHFLDPEDFNEKLKESGVVAILLPHLDHFVTAYVDSNYQVRGSESIILIKKKDSSVVVKPSKNQDLEIILEKLQKDIDPSKNYLKFLATVIKKITSPEDLFVAGRKTGKYLWIKRREPIIKMGAKFTIQPDLVLKNEIVPLIEKHLQHQKIKIEDQTITIDDLISPQFTIGVIQGILDALQEYMKDAEMSIEIKYLMEKEKIFLTVLESKI